MTVRIAPPPLQQFFASGVPAASYKLFTYAAGTTTKLATYTDGNGGTPNTNPIILDSQGQCNIWLTQGSAYKFVLAPPTDTDPPTNSVWTRDLIYGVNDSVNVLAVASAVGSADAIVASFSPAITALTNNTVVYVKAAYANATTTPTFTPNNGVILPSTIVKGNNLPLVAGDIQPGYWLEMVWNSTWARWVLVNPATGISAAPLRPVSTLSTNYVVTTADIGKVFPFTLSPTFTLPASSVNQNGFSVTFINVGSGAATMATTGGDTIVGMNGTTIPAATLGATGYCFTNGGAGVWYAEPRTWIQPGRFINVQVFSTPGTATYTPTVGTTSVVVEAVAGGGGGNIASSTTTTSAAAGGGGSGAYAKVLVTSAFAGVTVTVGAAGLGGASPGNGGTTSFGTIVSCPGGSVGTGGTNVTGSFVASGGAGGTAPTIAGATAIVSSPGANGGDGIVVSGSNAINAVGRGGLSSLGVGGPGSGGKGGSVGGVLATSYGTAGTAGQVIVYEYA